jgi:DNA-binding NarL/FixJ family response regulator
MRLVIVDDHPEMVSTVAQLLRAHYDIIATTDKGSEAVEAITVLEPDCVVLDISMPDLSGIEVAQRLKAIQSYARIVFLTVQEYPEFVQEALAAGANGYVLKSQLTSDLPAALKRALAGDLFISPSINMN